MRLGRRLVAQSQDLCLNPQNPGEAGCGSAQICNPCAPKGGKEAETGESLEADWLASLASTTENKRPV